MKQTAVEWLIEQISSSKYFYNLMEEIESRSTIVQPNVLQQAKTMEKEQIIQTEKEMYNKLMANKTAMYKLKTHLDNEVKLGFLDTKYNERIQWYIDTYFIEAEKEQIIDAAKSCNYIGGATNIEAEKYYNQKYNQNK